MKRAWFIGRASFPGKGRGVRTWPWARSVARREPSVTVKGSFVGRWFERGVHGIGEP
jgi:hypothetical protein